MKFFMFRTVVLIIVLLLLVVPVSAAEDPPTPSPVSTATPEPTALPEPPVSSNPIDDITGGLDAMPVHLGVAPLVLLIIEILKRARLLKTAQATWAARALGGVLWLLAVVLPADVLADVTRTMGALGALGWSLLGSEKLYDFGRGALGTSRHNTLDASDKTV